MKFPLILTISAEAVAWYAGIVATLSLVVNILKYLRDRANIKVKWKKDIRIVGESVYHYKKDKNYIAIKVMNMGKRPITIVNVGYITKGKDKPNAILTDSFTVGKVNFELKEGKSQSYYLEQDIVDLSKIKYFVVVDATDREYKARVSLFSIIALINQKGW